MSEANTPDAGRCLSEGWQLYLREPMLLSVAALIVGIANAVASWVPFASLLIGPPLLGSLYLMVMAVDRGDQVSLSNLGDGFKYFLPLVLASVLVSIIIGVGLILLVIPGLYFALAYGFTTLNIVDKGLEFWPAMETSRKTITSVFWSYLVLGILMLVIIIIGSIPFGLGLVVAIPVCIAAQYSYYKALHSDESGEVI